MPKPLDFAKMVQMLRSSLAQPTGDVVRFRNPNEIVVPLPEPNVGYTPTPLETEFFKKFLERGTIIPFPKK